MFKQANSLFFDDQEQKFWQSYRQGIQQIHSTKHIYEGILFGSDSLQKPKQSFYQLFNDHLVRYEDYKEYKTNLTKAQDSAKILFLTTVNLEIFEINKQSIPSEFRFNLELSQNEVFLQWKNQHFICCKSEDEMLVWYEKLKTVCIINHFENVYKLTEKIGQGAFAYVYKAIRNADQEVFAIKMFEKNLILKNKNPKLHMKSIIKEIKIMRYFDDQIQTKLYEVYQTESRLFLVMEYLKGPELFQQIVKKGPFKEKEACIVFKQLLHNLHSLNVIHRDIKPENLIFVDKNSLEIKVIDYGLAEFVQDPEVLFKRSGTPGYVSPEILKDKPYNQKTDLFSLGVILYQLLTGCTPFFGDNIQDIVIKNTKGEVCYDFEEINLKISSQGVDLMKQLLKVNPEHRISAEKALQHSWITKYFDVNQEKVPIIMQQRLSMNSPRKNSSQKKDKSFLERFGLTKSDQKKSSFHSKASLELEKCSPITKKCYEYVLQSPEYINKKSLISDFLSKGNNDTIDSISETTQKPNDKVMPSTFVKLQQQKIY